ncbi:hypothetical protein BH18ACI4_BH18ACI4_26130 [soil metagenome]
MKKLLGTALCLVVLIIAAMPVGAQTRYRASNRNAVQKTRQYERYSNRVNRADASEYQYERNRSVWDKHRDKITTVGGAAGGAIPGELIGGKKGALIGAITGGAGAAVYTYKVREKTNY